MQALLILIYLCNLILIPFLWHLSHFIIVIVIDSTIIIYMFTHCHCQLHFFLMSIYFHSYFSGLHFSYFNNFNTFHYCYYFLNFWLLFKSPIYLSPRSTLSPPIPTELLTLLVWNLWFILLYQNWHHIIKYFHLLIPPILIILS